MIVDAFPTLAAEIGSGKPHRTLLAVSLRSRKRRFERANLHLPVDLVAQLAIEQVDHLS